MHASWSPLAGHRIVDLAHPLDAGIPVSPNHPGFKMALQRRHGDHVRADGSSAANEMLLLGCHTSTHVDALCHVSHRGKLFGDVEAAGAQSGGKFKAHGAETIPITVARGVLLDIARLRGVVTMAAGEAITAADLASAARAQHVEVRAGDVVLIGTGWAHHWGSPGAFLGLTDGAPGPDESAAQWLAERGVRMTGAETTAYECIPPGRGHALLPVHRLLLVEHGIHVIEMLNLTELAAGSYWEFGFVLSPLKLVGATGSPVRPFALVS
jgi:kynurenine formamidase